MVICKKD